MYDGRMDRDIEYWKSQYENQQVLISELRQELSDANADLEYLRAALRDAASKLEDLAKWIPRQAA